MSEIMRPIPFGRMMNWSLEEYQNESTIFGIHKNKFYRNKHGNTMEIFGDKITSPTGPAAGPNAQLAQNIIASYLTGSRFIELKTVQKMDGKDLAACVPRPCINAEDEGYNVEWSTELTVPDAFDEYVKGWFAIQVLAKELGISENIDFAYNMSVGYDLEGIKTEKIDNYIEGMKDASKTDIYKECISWLTENISKFKKFTLDDLNEFKTKICGSITLSTLHGCPPVEIERIAKYLLDEKKVHTYVKCNPTLLGYEFTRKILNDMGYDYISFDDHHFKNDLQYTDALSMLKRLLEFADERKLAFGVKITNTFPVKICRNELPGEEMYMSGRSLYPLSLSVAAKLSNDFEGKLPISYSGGADALNIVELFKTGIRPITVATTILKPGGYERIKQLASLLEPELTNDWSGVNYTELQKLADEVSSLPNHRKEKREVKSRKTKLPLPLFDCYEAPCKEGGCPIEQQIPEYLHQVAKGDFKRAFEIIAIDNGVPSVTGTICNHECQQKCTRIDYDSTVEIRNAKLIASDAAQDAYIEAIAPPTLKTNKKVAVIGAGPAGVAAALFLRRNGVEVTVFEKKAKPFGIVQYVIPAFRIADEKIQRDFKMAEKMGANFIFNAGDKCDVTELKNEFDFVILAVGAWKEGRSPVKEGIENMYDALDFLEESKTSGFAQNLGKRVAVIGGGDVAMDCARAAKRTPGVEQVDIVYRRTREFMPAEPEEKRSALADGVNFMELLGPVTCGTDKSLLCEKMELSDWDESGRRGIKSTGETETLSFDTVICAVGAQVDTSIFEKNKISLDKWGGVVVNDSCESSVENVYVTGDCKAGPATIVAAVADSKKAVIDILGKLSLDHDFIRVDKETTDAELKEKKGILIEATQDNTDANRCLGCDQLCEICCGVCPNRANVAIKVPFGKNKHQIMHIDGMCNECGNCGIFCPHTGNPYKDKITLFWTEEDFKDSTNRGFLKNSDNNYTLRLEDGSVLSCDADDGKVTKDIWDLIHVVESNYAYYFV